MNKQPCLVIFDAMALIYRAHFALYKHPRLTGDGLNTSPILGFTNTIIDVLQKLQPTHAITAFDSYGPTWRHQAFSSYKAQREEQPEAITEAIPHIQEILKGFNIPSLSLEGEEADDIMGSLATQAAQQGAQVYLVTPDKDLGQLVSDQIAIYKPALGGKPSAIWHADEVKAYWGIQHVHQVQDIIALWGDASDNIPGVAGIGQKRAQQLIETFGSLENLLDNLTAVKGKMQELLRAGKENALISKKLAIIKTDLALPIDWSSATYQEPDPQQLIPLFAKLQFRTLTKRLFPTATTSGKGQMNLFQSNHAVADTALLKPHASYDPKHARYSLLTTKEEYSKLCARIEKEKAFAFDTETTSLDTQQADLLGISISLTPQEAYYLPYPHDPQDRRDYITHMGRLLQHPQLLKIGHNLKYDISILQQHGMPTEGPYFDTLIAHHLLAPDERHSLDTLAEKYLNYTPISITTLIGEKGKDQKNMRDVPLKEITIYACEDADITLQLYRHFVEEVKGKPFYDLLYDVEFPLIPVLADMEIAGMAINTEHLAAISKTLTQELEELTSKIHQAADRTFSIDSPKQLGEVLFDHMKIVDKSPKTPTGQYITNESILSKIRKKHPIIPHILAYRELKKLKSTYVDKLATLLSPKDHRLHTSFHQSIVSTGRLSSSQPNLQNIPIRTPRGRMIREAFVAPDANHVLLAADYSQIELRLMAHFSQDPHMLAAFKAGKDIHTATAAQVFDLPQAQVTSDMRRQAKMINFGIIYGISGYGLGQRLDMATRQATTIIETYFQQFPQVKHYISETIQRTKESGYVTTYLGRQRHLPDINSRNATTRAMAERFAINMPIQGTAAEIIKMAMVKIAAWLKEEKLQSKMILQVHDELLFEVPHHELDHLKKHIPSLMEENIQLKVPLVVTIGTGQHWLEAH